MFPSTPPEDGGRDPWPDGARPGRPATPRGTGAREPLAASGRATPGGRTYGAAVPTTYPAGPEADDAPPAESRRKRTTRRRGTEPTAREDPDPPEDGDEADDEEVQVVPVEPRLSLAIAGFAALLGIGLILGALTSNPDTRIPYAVVVFGVQLLFILAWTTAMRPPALKTIAAVCVVVAVAADAAAVLSATATLAPVGYVAAGGFVLAVLGQLVRRADRIRVTDTLGTTLLIVVGVVAFTAMIVLTRKPAGTQALVVCLVATGVALAVARLTDCVLPKPRMAPQVPRGAAGVVVGAMAGTLVSAVFGSYLVLPFTPSKGAALGLVAAGAAVLVDLAVNYAEAGRRMAGEPPTLWLARHLQGPLGGFALAAPAAYAMAVLFLA